MRYMMEEWVVLALAPSSQCLVDPWGSLILVDVSYVSHRKLLVLCGTLAGVAMVLMCVHLSITAYFSIAEVLDSIPRLPEILGCLSCHLVEEPQTTLLPPSPIRDLAEPYFSARMLFLLGLGRRTLAYSAAAIASMSEPFRKSDFFFSTSPT